MSIEKQLYHYRAFVVSVFDGDTIRADIDLGMFVWKKDTQIRLARINTPELRLEEYDDGIISRDFVRDLILNKEVVLKTYKDGKGKYGRWIADIFVENESGEKICVNDLLVEEGLAEYVEY